MDNLSDRDAAEALPLAPSATWLRYEKPFTHVVAQNVLAPQTYDRLEQQALGLLVDAKGRTDNYDARIRKIDATIAKALYPLFSPAWFSLARQALGVDAEPLIDAAIHDHPAGSRAGWAHNDFNPGRFASVPVGDVVFSGSQGVEYRVRADGDTAGASMRKVAGLFYLGNPDWLPEHGGETGLYWNGGAAARLAKAVPPINNSVLLFECSPHSFHGFLGGQRQRRSIVFWLHCPLDEALSRWPGSRPVFWP